MYLLQNDNLHKKDERKHGLKQSQCSVGFEAFLTIEEIKPFRDC